MTESDKNWEDPIVKEVRAVRDAHAKQFGHDLKAIFDDHKRFAEELKRQGHNLTSRPPKRFEKKTGTTD